MWGLGYKESWSPKNLCFWTVVLEKTFESPLDCKEIQPVHPKANQPWIFIGRTGAEAEAPILWPPNVKNWFICFCFCFLRGFLFLFYYFLEELFFFTLQYCIGFAIHWHESARGVHVFPILKPPPTSLPIPSLWVIPVHQPRASCIMPQTWTGNSFTYNNIHVLMPFSQTVPPSPSPTESKRLFYTSVSLLLSHIQGYRYHLSKFHIYALVYCIGVFLSGLLHSV